MITINISVVVVYDRTEPFTIILIKVTGKVVKAHTLIPGKIDRHLIKFGLIYIIKFGLIKTLNQLGWLMGWYIWKYL